MQISIWWFTEDAHLHSFWLLSGPLGPGWDWSREHSSLQRSSMEGLSAGLQV